MSDEASLSVARALRQELEGWRRAGLSHLPMPPRKRVAAPANEKSSRATPSASPPTRSSPAPLGSQPVAAISRPSGVQTATASMAGSTAHALPVVVGPTEPSPYPAGSREDRQWRLDQLRQRVAACTRCEELAKARTQTVFGVGSPEARIMFVGEAPGADEDAQGIPFVGAAGQLMDRIITASGLKREELYICNVLRCRPPGNRKPLPQEAANCREYLDGQIAIIDPDYIICWGATAAQNLLNTLDSIGRLRGRFLQFGRAKVLCTYHPSYLLRQPSAKKDVWDDMKLFLKEAGLPVPT
jgi:uracil-DNA glycosylase